MIKLKSTQAFTVIELATVLVIILIISGLIVGASTKIREVALKTKTESIIAALEVAISMYRADTGEYPADDFETNAELVSDMLGDPGDVTGWQGPYMEFKIEDLNGSNEVVDPWGELYRYEIAPAWGNTNSYNLWSTGLNRTNDSGPGADTEFEDDIYNW